MAITKKYLKSRPICRVTFSIVAKDAEKVGLVGSFNEWIPTPLKKFKNGSFKVTVDLNAHNSYEFRYIVDGAYVNDEAADHYVWNDFAAANNSIVNV